MMTSGELILHNQVQVLKLEIERLKRQQKHESLVNDNLRCKVKNLTLEISDLKSLILPILVTIQD